jgi:hypothetical protein
MITSPMQAQEYNVVDSFWFGYIGIVRVKTGNGDIKYYIGQGKGEHQHADEQHIAGYGQPVSLDGLNLFLNAQNQ